MIQIKTVETKQDLKKFIDFPHELYSNDSHYVPELFLAQKDLLNKKNNPFFESAEATLFLALQNEQVVGRIAAVKNDGYIEYTSNPAGQFGFFEVIEDYEVATVLLDTVSKWIQDKDLTIIQGPYNFSTNDTCGTLVEGYDSSPTIMMPYNPPYYNEFLTRYGFEKDMDLLSYNIVPSEVPQKLLDLSDRLLKRLNSKGITVRKGNMKDFNNEVKKIFSVYNQAWEKNWGFVPMTEKQFSHAAKDMKMILDPDFLQIAELNGETIGFSLCIPDMNQVFKKIKRGRLLPFGIFKLLFLKRKVNKVRVLTLGIVKEYRKLGIDAFFYAENFKQAQQKNLAAAEASWILENNEMMNQALIKMNAKVYKRHRLYQKSIN